MQWMNVLAECHLFSPDMRHAMMLQLISVDKCQIIMMSLFQAAFDCAIDYAQNRSAFGQPIANLQTIQV